MDLGLDLGRFTHLQLERQKPLAIITTVIQTYPQPRTTARHIQKHIQQASAFVQPDSQPHLPARVEPLQPTHKGR